MWKTKKDVPENNREILLFQESGLSHTKIFEDNRSFKHYVGLFQIVKWCYTKDIESQQQTIQEYESRITQLENALKKYADKNEWHKADDKSPWALLFNSKDFDGDGFELAIKALKGE